MRGFTLVEVLVAFFILGVGVLVLFLLQGVSLRYVEESRYNSEAAFIMRSELEKVRASDFDSLASESYSVVGPSGQSYSVSRSVDTLSSELKKVTITVSFDSSSITSVTLVSKK